MSTLTPKSADASQIRKRTLQIAITALVAIALLALTLGTLRPAQAHSSLAAIVNNDEPIEIDGQPVPMGRQLAAEFALLDGPLEWEITTDDRAEAGLRSGKYQGAVIIPAGFSAEVTSLSSLSGAVQATVETLARPGASAEERAEVELDVWKATANLGSMLTEEFVVGMFGGLGEMGEQLQVAADGAGQLADGTEQAQSGTAALADGGRQLEDGAGQAADGLGLLADGTWELADGTDQAAEGLGQLAAGTDELGTGLGQLAVGARDAADGADALADGMDQLSEGGGELAAGIQQLADGGAEMEQAITTGEPGNPNNPGLAPAADNLASGAEGLAVGIGELSGGLKQYVDGVNQIVGPLSDAVTQLNEIVQELAPYLEDSEGNKEAAKEFLKTLKKEFEYFCAEEPTSPICNEGEGTLQELLDNIDEIYAVIDQVADGLEELPTQMAEASEGLAQLKDAGDQMFDEESDESIPALEAGANALAGGMREYADGMATFGKEFGTFAKGLDTTAKGTKEYMKGVDAAAKGAGDLAGGIDQLAGGLEAAAGGVGDLSAGAWQAADGVGLLADGATQIADGTDQAADGVGQLGDGAGQLADGADQLGDGLGEISGGMKELSDGLGMAGEALPEVDEQQAEALGQSLASPVERPTLAIGTQAGPAMGLALLLWLVSLLLQSVYPPAVSYLSSSTRSSGTLMLEALWKPAAWTASIGAIGGLILAVVADPGVGPALALLLFGALVGAIFAAVQQALALVFGRGWITASVTALVLGVSAALASAHDSLLATIAGVLPAGEASKIFTFLLVPGASSAAVAILMLSLWGALALVLSSAATAGKRKTPEKAEAAAGV